MTEEGNMRILTEAQHGRLDDPVLTYYTGPEARVVGWNERLHGPIVRGLGGVAYTLTARGHLTRARGHDG